MPLILLLPPSLARIRASARADRLATELGRHLGENVQVEVASTYRDLEEKVLSGTVDLAWAPPSVCARAQGEALAILKSVRNGRSMYGAALVARKNDTPSLSSLDGLRAAWVDPLSVGGHLLAFSFLRSQGVDPAQTFASQKHYGSYQGALLAVLNSEADISAIYCRHRDEESAQAALHEHVGASNVRLAAFAFTHEAPSDGLIICGRSDGASDLLKNMSDLASEARDPALLLELFEAESLELATRGDYTSLHGALDEHAQ